MVLGGSSKMLVYTNRAKAEQAAAQKSTRTQDGRSRLFVLANEDGTTKGYVVTVMDQKPSLDLYGEIVEYRDGKIERRIAVCIPARPKNT
jgi:hypothetical protein